MTNLLTNMIGFETVNEETVYFGQDGLFYNQLEISYVQEAYMLFMLLVGKLLIYSLIQFVIFTSMVPFALAAGHYYLPLQRRNRKTSRSVQLEVLVEPKHKESVISFGSQTCSSQSESIITLEEKEEEVELEEPEFVTIHYGTEKEILKEMEEAMREQSKRSKKTKTKTGCFPSFSIFNFAKSSKRVGLMSKSVRKRGFSILQKKKKGGVFV